MHNIVNYRASYKDEVKNLLQYMKKEYYVKIFVFFYQGSYGISALQEAKKLLKGEKDITILRFLTNLMKLLL